MSMLPLDRSTRRAGVPGRYPVDAQKNEAILRKALRTDWGVNVSGRLTVIWEWKGKPPNSGMM